MAKTLKLTTRKVTDVTVCDLAQLQNIHNLFHVVKRGTSPDQVLDTLDGALHSTGNLINILRLDDSLQVVLQHLGEVVYM
jgi:hypothetical protein